jgi:uncharacterized protein
VKEVYGLPAADILLVAGEQLRYVDEARETLDRRVSAGRVVEGHGDLRPEHIFLTDPPGDHRLPRVQSGPPDPGPARRAELPRPRVCPSRSSGGRADWFLDVYRDATGDESPADLLGFYRRFRALRRAKVAVWHLRDEGIDDADKWRDRAKWYVATAVGSLSSG